MITIKFTLLLLVFAITTFLGLAFANKYKNRVKDLKEIRNILNILETKIRYTYEPLPHIFEEISKKFSSGVGEIFEISSKKMKDLSAGEAWSYALENTNTSMSSEDINVLKTLEKLLGKTSIEGQLSEIALLKTSVDMQLQKAEEERRKNEKLYKNLGIIVGLAIVIILI